jgi:predicted RNase H-like nuclease (RuvC/YqgF family)
LTSAGSANATASAGDTARTAAIFALESKLSRIAEKLKLSEDENKNLNVENLKINVLKDSLREKNNSIQELKRNFDDREKNKNIDGGLSKDKSSDDLRLKIVDYMEENKTLKRALAAATMGHRTPSVDRIAK